MLIRLISSLLGSPNTSRGFERAADFYKKELPNWSIPSVETPSLKSVENGWKDAKSVDEPCTKRGTFCSGINKPANLVR